MDTVGGHSGCNGCSGCSGHRNAVDTVNAMDTEWSGKMQWSECIYAVDAAGGPTQ